jgi:hypothetical protein
MTPDLNRELVWRLFLDAYCPRWDEEPSALMARLRPRDLLLPTVRWWTTNDGPSTPPGQVSFSGEVLRGQTPQLALLLNSLPAAFHTERGGSAREATMPDETGARWGGPSDALLLLALGIATGLVVWLSKDAFTDRPDFRADDEDLRFRVRDDLPRYLASPFDFTWDTPAPTIQPPPTGHEHLEVGDLYTLLRSDW